MLNRSIRLPRGNRSLDEARARNRRETITRLLWEVDRRILQREPLYTVLADLTGQLADLYRCPLVWVGLKEPDGRIVSVAQKGLETDSYLSGLRWDDTRADPRPMVQALRTQEVQMGTFTDVPGDGPWRQDALNLGMGSYVVFPLGVDGQIVGALALASADRQPPIPETLAALQSIANQVAISILCARANEQNKLQQVALEASPNGVILTDADGLIRWVNEAFTRITGFAGAQALGHEPRQLLRIESSNRFWVTLAAALRRSPTWRGEIQSRRPDGTPFICETTVTAVPDDRGASGHHVWTLHDVTDRREGEARLQYLTLHDPLTGLPNRRNLEEYLSTAVRRSTAARPRALIVLGIDRLRLINDILGVAAGHELLSTVAQILRERCGTERFLARMDEDNFAVVASVQGTEAAALLAEELRAAVASSQLQGWEGGLSVTASLGALLLTGDQGAAEALRQAAEAMTMAKRRGRNQVVLADSSAAGEPTRAVRQLQEALAGSGFLLYQQPIIDLASGETAFYEVLLRLQGPDGTLLLPGQFLEAAAQYDLLPQVDSWVVTEVLRRLEVCPNLKLFVNLTGQGLSSLPLLDEIEAQLRALTPLDCQRITFEITEAAAVRDLARAREWMRRLADLGVQFALDDFGSGFSSFEYLSALPVQYVKLSGSFVRHIDTDPRHRAMVEAATAVAHALEKQVIAEWVETPQVATLLAGMGVAYGQGFGLGRPAPMVK